MSNRSEAACVAILLCVACAVGAAGKKRGRSKPVIEVTRQVALLPPAPVNVPGVPIRPVDLRVPLPKAPVPQGAGCARVFCNDGLNSRLPSAVATEGWKVRWSAPVVPDFTPTAVVQDGPR